MSIVVVFLLEYCAVYRNERVVKRKTVAPHCKKCGELPKWNGQSGTLWVGVKPWPPTVVAHQIVWWMKSLIRGRMVQNKKQQKQRTPIPNPIPSGLEAPKSQKMPLPTILGTRINCGEIRRKWDPLLFFPIFHIFLIRHHFLRTAINKKNLASKYPVKKWGEIKVSRGI